MQLCIFNPEHDLCLAKGRAHYVPPRSAVQFALRDAGLMRPLYPGAQCFSVYDPRLPDVMQTPAFRSAAVPVVAWGWDAVVKHELLKRGAPPSLLPTDEAIATIRRLQHRSTILPLQDGCLEVRSADAMDALLAEREHWVLKAPWSGAGRGLRWVHGRLTPIDRDWIAKTAAGQQCVIAEPRREVQADVALEYMSGRFAGYSLFRTGSGVYKENVMWSDARIAEMFRNTALARQKARVEEWLAAHVWPCYDGPLGIDLMVCADGGVHVAEMNVRHTMGMVAHEKIKNLSDDGIC